jgi:CheY-like chemotaxis protein
VYWTTGCLESQVSNSAAGFDLLIQSIPIFVCSGAVSEADKKAAFSAGAHGYVGKPFDPDDLIATLRAALNIQNYLISL